VGVAPGCSPPNPNPPNPNPQSPIPNPQLFYFLNIKNLIFKFKYGYKSK